MREREKQRSSVMKNNELRIQRESMKGVGKGKENRDRTRMFLPLNSFLNLST